MPAITHVFFDLHGTLIDGVALHPCYSTAMGRILAARYGGDPAAWARANTRVLADWDSYYADLNLSGEEGLADHKEGLYRTTRAMFRLMKVAEPPKSELAALAWELPGKVTWNCDAMYADVRDAIKAVHAEGYILGVTSHAIVPQARGLLNGGGLTRYFEGPIIGPDNAEQFDKDEAFYRLALSQAGAKPAQCVVVEDKSRFIEVISGLGIHAVQIRREDEAFSPQANVCLRGNLSGLRDALAGLRASQSML